MLNIVLSAQTTQYDKIADVFGFDDQVFIADSKTPNHIYDRIIKIFKKYAMGSTLRLLVSKGLEQRLIDVRNVIYFEIFGRIVTVHYEYEETFEFYSNFGELEERLHGIGFCRAHRSFLVNPEKVHAFTMESVTMKNKEILPIGRKYAHALRECIENLENVIVIK